MNTSDLADAVQRLSAYIYPRTADTPDEVAALERAAEAQLSFEQGAGSLGIAGVTSASVDGLSVTYSKPLSQHLNEESICPLARAILLQAGLLAGYMPMARRR